MAFDGIVIANLVKEFSNALTGGKIAKITQTERDELLFTIKNFRETKRLLLSVNASLPLAYLTDTNKQGPMTAPNFCMLLRKHIGSGRIVSVSQPGLERCIHFEIEHLDEMGDLCRKLLIVELMGKYSNIIFCSPDGTILDSIKHISVQVSSVREVLPGRQYFLPQTVAKQDPLTASADDFAAILAQSPAPAGKAIYTNFTGISPVMAEEFCYEASIDADHPASELNELERTHLGHTLELAMESIKNGQFSPCIVYREDEPMEFAALPLTSFPPEYQVEHFDSISKVLETYYASKNVITRIRQKSSDLRRIVQTALERNYKKYDLQQKQLKDTEKRDKYKLYGELLNTYGYELTGGEKELVCTNYYTGKEVKIPLDPQLTARENSQKYFDKYGKLKRTFEAQSQLIEETKQGRDLHRLEMMSADPRFSPADLPELAGSLKSLQERVAKKKRWGSAFKEPEIRRRIAMLDKFASGLSSARQAETAFLAKGDGDTLLSARQVFWHLGLSPLFAENRYVHEKGKMFSGRILQAVEDEKLPLEERGRLLAAERSMLLDDQIFRSRLDALKEKLETESNTLCDRLYAEWCKAAPAEKRALAETILRKAGYCLSRMGGKTTFRTPVKAGGEKRLPFARRRRRNFGSGGDCAES